MKIAITGGIGSGKTTLVNKLKLLLTEFNFVNIDDLVRELYEDTEIKAKLFEYFGTSDRKAISDIVFQAPEKLRWVEGLFGSFMSLKLNLLLNAGKRDIIVEFPLLFEMGMDDQFDKVIAIVADEETRIERVMKRNGFTREKIKAIIASQGDWHDHAHKCDLIIDTTDSDLNMAALRAVDVARGITRGIVAGSFDPITEGHMWLIEKALDLVDAVDVVVAYNPNKKGLFDFEERKALVAEAIRETPLAEGAVNITALPQNKMLVAYARETGSKFVFRGIRNVTDFDYETQLNLVNKKIAPEVETVFLMPPSHLTEVSSSVVKSMLHLEGWESAVRQYVPECVLRALKKLT